MSGSYLLIFHIYIYINESPDTLLHSIHYMPYITCQHSITPHCRCIGSGLLPLQDLRRVLHSHGKAFLETSHKFCKKRIYIYIYIYGAPPSPAPHPQKKEQNCQNASKDAKSSYNLYIYIYIYVYSCSHVLLISLKVQQSCQKSKFCWRNAWLPHDTGHEVALANGTAMHRSLKPHFARLQRNYWARKHSNCSRCRSPSAWVAASPWKLLGLLWMK